MNLEDLGNLGDFLAAVGVIVSLIYLAAQIKQNTRQIADPDAWGGHTALYSEILAAPGVRTWWQTQRQIFSAPYREFIDGLISAQDRRSAPTA